MASAPDHPSPATERLLVAVERHTGRPRRRAGRETKVVCPCHDDHDPSLDVREGRNGLPICVCRVCGARLPDVMAVVGLEWGDIYDEDTMWTPQGPASDFYEYEDAAGVVRMRVFRVVKPGGKKEFPCCRPDPTAPKGWRWNLQGVDRVLYRLPRVLEAAAGGELVWVVEGEKDVDTLERLGEVATCNPGGAGKWRPEFADSLAGAHVVVVADRDEQGRRHAREVAASLRGKAASVRIVQTPLDREKADVTDHLDAGLELDALEPLPLEAVEVEGTVSVERSEQHDSTDPTERPASAESTTLGEGANGPDSASEDERAEVPESTGAPERRLFFLTGREFMEQPLQRIQPLLGTEDDAILMQHGLALLAGVGGAGKTTLALHALAHFCSGTPWLGIPVARPIRMVVIENEGPHDPFVKKVRDFHRRWDGDDYRDNVLFLDAPWGGFTWADDGLAEELRQFVRENSIDLVLANPLGRLGMEGAGTPEETRRFLHLLIRGGLNEDFGAILIHHLAKPNGGREPIDRVSGDWGPHPDTIMLLQHDGERRVKLSFDKVRWGDQGRPPMILEWLTDPDGPVGYRVCETPQEVTDDELIGRISDFLARTASSGPANATQIRMSVKGNAKRIRDALDAGVTAGVFVRGGNPKRPTFRLAFEPVDAQDELDWGDR